jgi:hypothetical protein
VTGRRLAAFLDALADGRRPKGFRARPEDADLLRTAIALRDGRPGEAVPDESFVHGLFQTLANDMGDPVAPVTRSPKWSAGRAALVSVAAAVALVGGSVAVTEAFSQAAVAPAAVQAPQGTVMRTGTFESADQRVVGQIVAYRGRPSWVYVKVGGSNYAGTIVCNLQVDSGATVATGAFRLHDGRGVLSKTVRVDVRRLRGAELVTPSGVVVASATFA